ncbi:hypothetical protein [Sapientia aquatica]|uniref:Curli production assembly/transport component CsgE n=1 Tax=Sapientia aquatica TaxID=1549640 RepID=A0A4R5W6V2_9BURK|nr:hypothetical protein [Sapientia aquatica]TDK67985.1 hypothetical protein E2I14_00010 [Sapientia aquatica]
MPFIAWSLILKPNYNNLIQYGGWFTYVLSKKTIQIFICFVEYEKVTWGQYKISTTTNWDRYEFSLVEANSANIIAHTFFTSLSDWVMNQVSARIQKLGHNDIIANLVD